MPAGDGLELVLLPASDQLVGLLLMHTVRAPKVSGMGSVPSKAEFGPLVFPVAEPAQCGIRWEEGPGKVSGSKSGSRYMNTDLRGAGSSQDAWLSV